nr:unnamed protein product [Spirometra erinaceieuropaei]
MHDHRLVSVDCQREVGAAGGEKIRALTDVHFCRDVERPVVREKQVVDGSEDASILKKVTRSLEKSFISLTLRIPARTHRQRPKQIRRFKFLTAESDTTVSSSAQFLEKLKVDLAIETIELLLHSKYDETPNRLGHAQVLQLLNFCLRTFFTLDEIIYEQVKSTPMGSPISAFIAEAVLKRLESLVFQHHRQKFWARYVDDTFVVIERDQVLTFKRHLNAVLPGIQFTMEEEENNQLAFLDGLVCRKDCGGKKDQSV